MVPGYPARGVINGSPTPTGTSGWKCPLCQLNSSQNSEESFSRHLNDLHKVDMDERRQRSEMEYQSYYSDLIRQAFLPSQPQHGRHLSSSSREPGPTLPPFGGSPQPQIASFGQVTPLDLQRLTLSGRESTQSPGPSIRMAPIAQDDSSRLSHPPRPSSSSRGPRLPIGRHHSPVHRQQRQMRPMPPQAESGFRRYTTQNRPASRELFDPVDDESRESRRKAPPTVGQPSSPRDLQRHQQQPHPPQPSHLSGQQRGIIDISATNKYPNMILQPESRGISQEQLATEVRVIYNELTAVEVKCIQLQKEQASSAEHGTISPNAWRGLISIHRQLLNFHHDFFLASQHPAAALPLHRLAAKYNMPARMWKHGIHSFLELLRHQLPSSLEFMVSFIYMAYHMMTLLLETVSAFEDTWIECLGDLSRYRMAVEEHDPKDRETWSITARYWYHKAADRMPNVGRLYHHLAILSRPNALQQLFMYSRSLISADPFLNTRESIKTLFTPVLNDNASYLSKADNKVVRIAASIFYRSPEYLKSPIEELPSTLDSEIEHLGPKWRDFGVFISGSAIGSLFDFGNKNTLLQAIQVGNHLTLRGPVRDDSDFLGAIGFPADADADSDQTFKLSRKFFLAVVQVVLQRQSDKNVHPAAHVIFAFLLILVSHAGELSEPRFRPLQRFLTRQLLNQLPWTQICRFLNTVSKTEKFDSARFEQQDFLCPQEGDGVLPEDGQLRGMVWTQSYFPKDLFKTVGLGEERPLEPASTAHSRVERILWIGHKLHLLGCLDYKGDIHVWSPKADSLYIHDAGTPVDLAKTEQSDTTMVDVESNPGSTRAVRDGSESEMMEGVVETGATARSEPPAQYEHLTLSQRVSDPVANASFVSKVQVTFKTVVIDLKIMLDGKVFPELIRHRFHWQVVVPIPVWNKLIDLRPEDERAEKAITDVEDAIISEKCVRIVEENGENVTEQAVLRGGPGKGNVRPAEVTILNDTQTAPTTVVESQRKDAPKHGQLQTGDENEEVLVKITRAASDLHESWNETSKSRVVTHEGTQAYEANTIPTHSNQASSANDPNQTETRKTTKKDNEDADEVEELTRNLENATLLTDNEHLLDNASKLGVFMLASSAFLSLLHRQRRNSLHHSRHSSGAASGNDSEGTRGNGSGETDHGIATQRQALSFAR